MESPSPGSQFITRTSKKRVFPGGSSSSGLKEVEVLETAPSGKRIATSSKRKEAAGFPEIIDVDIEEEYKDNGQADVKGKGKEIPSNISGDFSNLSNIGPGSDAKTSNKIIDLDEPNSNLFFGGKDWIDTYYDDIAFEDHSDAFFQSQFDHMNFPPGVDVPFPWLQSSPQNSTFTTSNSSSLKVNSNEPTLTLGPSASSSNSKNGGWVGKWITDTPSPMPGIDWMAFSSVHKPENVPLLSLGNNKMKAYSDFYSPMLNPFVPSMINPSIMEPSGFMYGSAYGTWPNDFLSDQNVETPAVVHKDLDEIKRNFETFKKFDTVEEFSGHHFAFINSSTQVKPPKNWAKKIQQEWKILEKDLPDTIFVRVCDSRMDLLRAVIVGAEGTPYHDGLFFFDVCFPCNYPNTPPKVHYHSGGLRLNPNLYNCGKVCLSLLNTWNGGKEEKWLPGVSTMLQVLVSIQGLILNAKPYFNEPGHAVLSSTKAGDERALQYNETAFLLSLRTMVYTMKRPPKHFEALVAGHFVDRARDILVSCKAYLDGAQVGCLVRGGVQDVDEGDRSCSQGFKNNLAGFIIPLVNEFMKLGAKDCHEFVPLADKGGGPVGPTPVARALKMKYKNG